MSPDQQTNAFNPTQNPKPPQTGPRTAQGKATSAQNSLKEGLFATHDFIRLGERDEYDRMAAALQKDLAPGAGLEELFTSEIISAAWRLRRCRLIEENFSTKFDEIDPMEDESASKTQKSVDRARAQSHSVIRRAIAEMRKIQTERQIRTELGITTDDGLAETIKIIKAVMNHGGKAAPESPTPAPEPADPSQMNPWDLDLNKPDHFAAFDNFIMTTPLGRPRQATPTESTQTAAPISFCKDAPAPAPAAPQVGRNEPCSCGSGLKFKKCCARTGEGWSKSSPGDENIAA